MRARRSQTMRLLSQGRTVFAPRFYEIKERDLTLCACKLACVAGGISHASAFVFVAKTWTEVAGFARDGIWRLRRSPALASRQLRRLLVSSRANNSDAPRLKLRTNSRHSRLRGITAGKWHTTRQHEQKGRIQAQAPQAQNTWCMRQLVYIENCMGK